MEWGLGYNMDLYVFPIDFIPLIKYTDLWYVPNIFTLLTLLPFIDYNLQLRYSGIA